jgi:hypothetical protein
LDATRSAVDHSGFPVTARSALSCPSKSHIPLVLESSLITYNELPIFSLFRPEHRGAVSITIRFVSARHREVCLALPLPDDLNQPLNWEAGAKSAKFGFLGYIIAQDDARPQWNTGDFFGRTFGGSH